MNKKLFVSIIISYEDLFRGAQQNPYIPGDLP
jgi:hypothetical protein